MGDGALSESVGGLSCCPIMEMCFGGTAIY